MMKISLLLVSKDEEKFAKNFFESVQAQTRKPDEIILVDVSKDRTPEIAKPYVNKLILADRAGAGYQRGIAVKHSTGDILAFTDVDTVVDKHWLEELEKMFQNPEIHVVRGLVEWPGKQHSQELPTKGKRINHCNTAYRRHVLEEIPFDPNLSRGDDWDMGHRVSKKYTIHGCSTAKVTHFSLQKIGWKNSKLYCKDWFALIKKYKSPYWLMRTGYNIFYPLKQGKVIWVAHNIMGFIAALFDEIRGK